MGILPIILFLLGVVFLFLGWRWQGQGLAKDQDKTVLKGMALLRREIINLRDQVNLLDGEVQQIKTMDTSGKKGQKESEPEETRFKDIKTEFNESIEVEVGKREELDLKARKEVEFNPLGLKAADLKKLDPSNDKEQKERSHKDTPTHNISAKYKQVLELAASGQRVPEIAQNLCLSQDAVQMVLKTQPKGVIR